MSYAQTLLQFLNRSVRKQEEIGVLIDDLLKNHRLSACKDDITLLENNPNGCMPPFM
ncbi:hypothetical protein SAMN06265368_0319 [Cohaesibacter gelatinilyticus]|uniref:Uncharacterized protein n=1 Tax=Cohaesibacter gelatinilyticus TaxID=372072 RepID=A0A285NER6_9HYPH|nr:hypothetical protein SAMN06265368_0319 [Cohaesibacter gelatinilyticus]